MTWNVWFTPPKAVDQNEGASHAWRWRQSIDVDHGSSDSQRREAKYYDGSAFKVDFISILKEEKRMLIHFFRHFEGDEKDNVLSAIKDVL